MFPEEIEVRGKIRPRTHLSGKGDDLILLSPHRLPEVPPVEAYSAGQPAEQLGTQAAQGGALAEVQLVQDAPSWPGYSTPVALHAPRQAPSHAGHCLSAFLGVATMAAGRTVQEARNKEQIIAKGL